MGILIVILKIITILLYLLAGLGIFVLLIGVGSTDEDGGSKTGIIVFFASVFFGICAYLLGSFSDELNDKRKFSQSFENGDKKDVIWKFSKLSDSEKDKFLESIFDKFYNKSFEKEYEFLNDFENEESELHFLDEIKADFNVKMKELYTKAENDNSDNSWLQFSKKIPGNFFLKFADSELRQKEFDKWKSDDDAWMRVLVMDSLDMSHKYLELFPDGHHRNDAKRIILNHDFNTSFYNKRVSRITSNYDGTTTVSIHNSSSNVMTFNYSGIMDKGSVDVPANSTTTINVPNGYYHINVHSRGNYSSSDYSYETFDGYKYLSYHLVHKQRHY